MFPLDSNMAHRRSTHSLTWLRVKSQWQGQSVPENKWMPQRSKEPLDESQRGEWKSWLKTQHSENEDHGIRSYHFMANRWGNNGNSDRLYFVGATKSLQMGTAAMKLTAPWKKSYDQPRQHIKQQRHCFANRGPSSQSYDFSSSLIWMRVGLQRKLSAEELMLLNCGVGEDF